MNVNEKPDTASRRSVKPGHKRLRRAFTLIELLVVIAITTIILALLFAPLIQGFNFTRRARAISAAQDSARTGLALMRRELSQAAYVFDNANTPVSFPLQENQVGNNNRLPLNLFDQATAGSPTIPFKPNLLSTKLDMVLPARDVVTNNTIQDPTADSYTNVDPNTGRVTSTGLNVRFPLAPGTRVVRYFIGLRRNLNADGTPAFYQNVYEFPRTDDGLNPFILYRAEFDAQDPLLFDPQNYGSAAADSGGFNDPDFFYNRNQAPNGATYAQNWARVAQPVIDNQNLDLLVVRRTDVRAIDARNPFSTTVNFAPTTVVGDTATPGFLSSDASEAPGAVPSLYTSKFSQWTLPYTVTFYRASTRDNPAARGRLTVRVSAGAADASGSRGLSVALDGRESLRIDQAQCFVTVSPTTQRIFVKTPSLTFVMDPARGRVETGFPPLAGTDAGVPYIDKGAGPEPMVPAIPDINDPNIEGASPATNSLNYGELVQTVFRINTRRTDAGQTDGNRYRVPANQGFLNVRLLTNQQIGQEVVADQSPTQLSPGRNYYLQSNINNALTAAQTPDLGGDYVSPRAIFGYMLIAPGTERVLGPSSTFETGGSSENVSYFRLPAFSEPTLAGTVPLQDPVATPTVYRDFTVSNPSYYFDYDLPPTDMLRFVSQPETKEDQNFGIPGLPARVQNAPGIPKELRVTYLWQNNYSRVIGGTNAPIGTPLDANGRSNVIVDNENLATLAGSPEPDVVKVDYSTRSIFAVTVGARVYDTGTGEAQFIQLADKIQINNVGR